MKRLLAIFALVIAFCSMAQAQSYTRVEGQVRDITGEPLIGVLICSIDRKCAAVTDLDGYFKISKAKPGIYYASYLGFKRYYFEVWSISAYTRFYITMEEDSPSLNNSSLLC